MIFREYIDKALSYMFRPGNHDSDERLKVQSDSTQLEARVAESIDKTPKRTTNRISIEVYATTPREGYFEGCLITNSGVDLRYSLQFGEGFNPDDQQTGLKSLRSSRLPIIKERGVDLTLRTTTGSRVDLNTLTDNARRYIIGSIVVPVKRLRKLLRQHHELNNIPGLSIYASTCCESRSLCDFLDQLKKE